MLSFSVDWGEGLDFWICRFVWVYLAAIEKACKSCCNLEKPYFLGILEIEWSNPQESHEFKKFGTIFIWNFWRSPSFLSISFDFEILGKFEVLEIYSKSWKSCSMHAQERLCYSNECKGFLPLRQYIHI